MYRTPYIPNRWLAENASYRPDRYYRYDHLTEMLHTWANDHQDLIQIESVGKSYEGRDIWAVTITKMAAGEPASKPACFVDANIHTGEVTGIASVLWLNNHLIENRTDEHIAHLLRTTTLYAVPAISDDGMERILDTDHGRIRSSVRPFPEPEPQDGLHASDIESDDIITQMWIRDEDGPWKISSEDARLMIKRAPDERGGDYYFVITEGVIQHWDGGAVPLVPILFGLDVNRNFPLDWGPHWQQKGSGAYPLSEPETRALADFLLAHPNIHGSQHFHTWGAAILRPSARKADDDVPKMDVRTFKAIGAMGTEVTGYPCISVFQDFAYDPKTPIQGVLMDWLNEHLGMFPFSTERWSLPRKAGIEVKDFIEFMKDRGDEVDLAMLKVLDQDVDGAGFKPWEPFDHPQLGAVEIGGWDYTFSWQNPPGPMLEEVTSGNATFIIRAMGTAPRIVLKEPVIVDIVDIGADVFRVSVVVQNAGFLPTNVSESGKASGVNKPVKAELSFRACYALQSTLRTGKTCFHMSMIKAIR